MQCRMRAYSVLSLLAVAIVLIQPVAAQQPTITVAPADPHVQVGTPVQFGAFQGDGGAVGIAGATQVIAGAWSKHTCALMSNGTVKCWGGNFDGQLGNGTTTDSNIPVTVTGIADAIALASGAYHTCALLSSGEVSCWGSNHDGELGNTISPISSTPVPVKASVAGGNLSSVIAIAAGSYHTCALLANGAVECWGDNTQHQLGTTGVISTNTPVVVNTLRPGVAIAAGAAHTCAVLADGTAQCWGSNTDGELGNGNTGGSSTPVFVSGLHAPAIGISAGGMHSCALLSDGTAQCWGYNADGELGDGTRNNIVPTPVTVTGLTGATRVESGTYHNCALMVDGSVQCWGFNNAGQLGDGTLTSSAVPVRSRLSGATSIAAGDYHSCATSFDGRTLCWGHGGFGQLGNAGSSDWSIPVWTRPLLDSVTAPGETLGISAGYHHNCALLSNGTVKCWGSGSFGQLGNAITGVDLAAPVSVAGISGATAISSGGYHSCAVISGGTANCWGQNNHGQLGNSSTVDSNLPVNVSGLVDVVAVAAGMYHSCAQLADGSVKCWGSDSNGQLGHGGPIADSTTPTAVVGLRGVTAIAAGMYHTCAVLSDGTARCWGDVLGNGVSGSSNVPVQVSGIAGAISIAASFGSTCVLLADGTVQCWGDNTFGQLGVGSPIPNTNSPVQVADLSGVTAITAGWRHYCATLSSGALMCWGNNADGQFGNGTTTSSNAPVASASVAGLKALTAGVLHTCGLLSSGTVKCWGGNGSGQLGDGTTNASTTPVATSPLAFVNWASSNPAVATIDSGGLALGVATGNTTITATAGLASATTTLTVDGTSLPVLTTTTVTSNWNPSGAGQPVVFTAAVTAGAGTPTGTVQFQIDGVASGDPLALSNGSASTNISTLSPRDHVITATYSGDAQFAPSTGTTAQSVGWNFLHNAGFDRDMAGWTTLGRDQQWRQADANNSQTSGSMFLSIDNTTLQFCSTGCFVDLAWQCFPVQPNRQYTFGGKFYLPSGQAAGDYGEAWLAWFTDEQCLSTPTGYGGQVKVSTLDQWTDTQMLAIAPADARYGRFVAGVGMDTSALSFAYLDDAYYTVAVPTITNIASSANPAPLGDSVTFTATVTSTQTPPEVTSGVVVFTDGGGRPYFRDLDSTGKVTLTLSDLTVGSHNISATFLGQRQYVNSGTGLTQLVTGFVPVITWNLPASIVYGTPLSATQLNATANVPGTFVYTPALGTVLNAGVQTVTATFVPADQVTYASTAASVTINVTRAVLTVTADNKSMGNGGALPLLTASYSGFLNGDTAATALTGAPQLATTATSTSGPGAYPITVDTGTLASANYTFAFFNGTLTVNPGALSLYNNFFVTGDYVVGSTSLQSGSGSITVAPIPDGADLVAAFLYWQTVEDPAMPPGALISFDNYSIVGAQQLGSDLPYTAAGVSGVMRVYRANVLGYLPVTSAGYRFANDTHQLSLPAGWGNAVPHGIGASLVVVYRYLSKDVPLRAVVIYDGAWLADATSQQFTQNVTGFYDPTGLSASVTYLYSSAGAWTATTEQQVISGDSYFASKAGGAWGAIILSTAVNAAPDGLLSAWKSLGGYHDARDNSWVELPDASSGQQDLFIQIDYMCSDLNADGTCNTATGHSHLPSLDALEKVAGAFAAQKINVHFDIGNNYQGAPHIVSANHAKGGNIILEEACTDIAGAPPRCIVPGESGLVGWKMGLGVLKSSPRNPASCATGGDCSPRFPHGRKDSYHYVLFGHSLAIPAWGFAFGNLQAIDVTGNITTIRTTVPHRLALDASPRITIVESISQPNLNGIYVPTILDDYTFSVQTTNVAGPITKITDPALSIFSGRASGASGFSDVGGADSVVTLGDWKYCQDAAGHITTNCPANAPQDDSARVNVQAGTLMHELGHALGLSHGGIYLDTPSTYVATWEANCKPNYQSVMNYLFQIDLLGSGHDVVNYSGQVLPTIDESVAGNASSWTAPAYSTTSWYALTQQLTTQSPATTHCDGSPIAADEKMYRVDDEISRLSWSGGQDVNFSGNHSDTMRGYNDWAHADLRQIGATGSHFISGGVLLANGGGVLLPNGGGILLPNGGGVLLGDGSVVLPNGAGVLLPNGGGVLLPNGGGVLLANGGGVLLPNGGGVLLANGGGVLLPNGGGIILPNGGGVLLPNGGGVLLPNGGGVLLPNGGGVLLPNGGGVLLANGGGVLLPNGGGVLLPNGGGVLLPNGGGVLLANGGGVLLPNGGGVLLPNGGGVLLPNGGGMELTYEAANSVVRPPRAASKTQLGTAVRLDWTAPNFGVVTAYTVYRSTGGQPAAPIATVTGNPPPTTYTDLNSTTAATYFITTTVPDQAGVARQSAPSQLAVVKVDQTITFPALPNLRVGDPDFTPNASASSGLPVTFTVTGGCTASNNVVSIVEAGSCTITASQTGNSQYNAAAEVAQTLLIASPDDPKWDQTISFGPLPPKTYGDAPFVVSATASSHLTVIFSAAGNCIVAGTVATITGGGSCTITASQAGNAAYNAAPDVHQAFTVAKANQTITFGDLPNNTLGDPDFTVSASATSGLPVTFNAAGSCTITDNTVHITGVNLCTITALQNGDGNYNAAPPVARSFHTVYAACPGDSGRQVLQPINPAIPWSSFNAGRTVPVKFHVCSKAGTSVGTPGVVVAFGRVASATSTDPVVSEDAGSTTPDSVFRWDTAAQQWIFNLSTKGYRNGTMNYFRIDLNDGTSINFQFNTK